MCIPGFLLEIGLKRFVIFGVLAFRDAIVPRTGIRCAVFSAEAVNIRCSSLLCREFQTVVLRTLIRDPSRAGALKALGPHSTEVFTQWKREMSCLGIESQDFLGQSHLDFDRLSADLRKMSLPGLSAAQVQELGGTARSRSAAVPPLINQLDSTPLIGSLRSAPLYLMKHETGNRCW